MIRLKSGKQSIHGRLTADDLETIERERSRTGERYLSSVVERLLVKLLDETQNGKGGLRIVPRGECVFFRNYLIPWQLKERINVLKKNAGFNDQQILRAAIAMAAKQQS